MDGVATPIIGRPRPLPGHDTPNPAYHPHTLNYEEPRKSVTIGVCVPRVPSTKPAGCKAAGYAYSRRASNTRYLTCLLAISTSHLRSPGVSVENIYACSLFNMSVGQALMEAEISTLTSSRVSSYLAELTRLDRIFKR